MAARSFVMKVYNYTGEDLVRTEQGLAHGEWTEMAPEKIANGDKVTIGSESNGLMTGTEGHANYTSASGEWRIYWDNPYWGSNQFSVVTPPGSSSINDGIGGDNAAIRLVLLPR